MSLALAETPAQERIPATLPPFPRGWYQLGLSRDLAPGAVERRVFCGRPVVLFRTESGAPALVDAYCPHLGADMGRGGAVRGECLRCPFHGFLFDRTGACTGTGYGTPPPPKARVESFEVREAHGLLLAWFDPAGAPPDFEVPALDMKGFGRLHTVAWPLRSHPQETTENSVDLGHLSVVHGYDAVEPLSDLTTEGPYLHARYAMTRSAGIFGRRTLRAEFDVHVHGLGYSYVDVRVPRFELHSRHFVLPTPTEAGRIELRIAMCLERVRRPWKVHPLFGLLPPAAATALLGRLVFRGYAHDVTQDFRIWESKTWIPRPALARGDGPIGAYRRWCRQFYPPLL